MIFVMWVSFFLSENKSIALTVYKNFFTGTRGAEHFAVTCFDASVAFSSINNFVFIHPFSRRNFEDFQHG